MPHIRYTNLVYCGVTSITVKAPVSVFVSYRGHKCSGTNQDPTGSIRSWTIPETPEPEIPEQSASRSGGTGSAKTPQTATRNSAHRGGTWRGLGVILGARLDSGLGVPLSCIGPTHKPSHRVSAQRTACYTERSRASSRIHIGWIYQYLRIYMEMHVIYASLNVMVRRADFGSRQDPPRPLEWRAG